VNNSDITVSVWMITYNHEKYIAKAIDSVLMQTVNFNYEIVIGEDCSTDKTREILFRYKAKYPNKIKLLLHEKNIGIAKNMTETFFACTGKYIAMLEGDDYWINPNKLQIQVDFLENNPDFVLCYHKVKRVNHTGKLLTISNNSDKTVCDLKEILSRGWFMHTGSLVYRNFLIPGFPDFFYKYLSTDYMFHIFIAKKGKVGFINSVYSAYREHAGGITQDFQKNIIPFLNKKLCLLNEIDTFLNYEYSEEIKIQKKDINASLFIYKLKSKKIKNFFSGVTNFVRGNKKAILNRIFIFGKKRISLIPKLLF